MAKQLKKPVFNKFNDIKPATRYNFVAKVAKVEFSRELKRIEGEPVKIAICIVGDETGCSRMLFKGPQTDFAKEGEVLIIRNAMSKVVKSYIRLEVDIWGKIEKCSASIESVKLDNNISTVEYETIIEK